MRVIAGEYRSRRLQSIPGPDTRPTPDRLRETLFDILGTGVEGAVFLDAYAGTGAVGIEALSRGASQAIFIERSKNASRVIHENLASLGIEDRGLLVTAAAAPMLGRHTADIVFLDPPYERAAEYKAALAALEDNPPPLLIVQHSVRFTPVLSGQSLRATRTVKQGDNALTFYASQLDQ